MIVDKDRGVVDLEAYWPEINFYSLKRWMPKQARGMQDKTRDSWRGEKKGGPKGRGLRITEWEGVKGEMAVCVRLGIPPVWVRDINWTGDGGIDGYYKHRSFDAKFTRHSRGELLVNPAIMHMKAKILILVVDLRELTINTQARIAGWTTMKQFRELAKLEDKGFGEALCLPQDKLRDLQELLDMEPGDPQCDRCGKKKGPWSATWVCKRCETKSYFSMLRDLGLAKADSWPCPYGGREPAPVYAETCGAHLEINDELCEGCPHGRRLYDVWKASNL